MSTLNVSHEGARSRGVFSAACLAVVALVWLLATALPLRGQPRGRLSPHETTTSTVDGATFTITYGRPSMRGRKIFGGLVPYDEVWMPGADQATIFKTTAALTLGTLKVPAGSYTLYTNPGARQWTLIINKMTGQFHTSYPKDQDLVHVPMVVERLPAPVEMLTITAAPRPPGGGALQLEWDTTRVSAPFLIAK